MRPAFPRGRTAALVSLVFAAVLACVSPARAADRLDLTGFWGHGIERLHSIGADTLGLSSHESYSGGAAMDFRVIDLPGKPAARPSIHLLGSVTVDERVLGPAVQGMNVGVYPVLDFGTGFVLELPIDALMKGNPGVALRAGWDGGYMLTRTGQQQFLEGSKARLDFVRTSGGLAGSYFGFGRGRDELYGFDAAAKRTDVHLSLQTRLASGPSTIPPTPPAPARGPAPPKPAPIPGDRLLWLFVDVAVDTDGGPGADGLRARAGLGLDLSTFFTAAFAPLHPH